ncbi:hypothetical protein X975_11292, partial [Stegodyphus mimosarum]
MTKVFLAVNHHKQIAGIDRKTQIPEYVRHEATPFDLWYMILQVINSDVIQLCVICLSFI